MQNLETVPFSQLLDCCSDKQCPYWESAWREFLRRYKEYIYMYIVKRCATWNNPRLRRQFSDIVNDAVADVFVILSRNDHQAIKDFRERDNEERFLAWLTILCSRAAGRHIRKNFLPRLVEGEIEEFRESLNAIDPDEQWELYETVVSALRQGSANERDINIFLTYSWADFSPQMISTLPCFRSLGHRVVDNVANRLRNALRLQKIF